MTSDELRDRIARAIDMKPSAIQVQLRREADKTGALWEIAHVSLAPTVQAIARHDELLRLIKRELAKLGFPRRVQAETAEDVAKALRRRREAKQAAEAEAEAGSTPEG